MANKRKELNIVGSSLWYLIGLITSDGCLSCDGRHIDITSKDYKFLVGIKNHFGLMNKVGIKNKDKANEAYHLQLSNKNFYEQLLSVGLKPAKSLTLKELKIPPKYFVDFLRGLIDGDGSIRGWIHPTNKHEQWSLRIYSGSQPFLLWVQKKIAIYLGCSGKVYSSLGPKKKNFLYILKYGKMAAKEILRRCYYQDVFGLDRKIKLASQCLESIAGWGKSKTLSFTR